MNDNPNTLCSQIGTTENDIPVRHPLSKEQITQEIKHARLMLALDKVLATLEDRLWSIADQHKAQRANGDTFGYRDH